ncbi:MAG: heavy metal translocating P-type ATPase [Patescibacteria group bacterium]
MAEDHHNHNRGQVIPANNHRVEHESHARHGRDVETPHPAHDKHAGHSAELFRRRFRIVLILTLFVLAYSPFIQGVFGFSPPAFPGSDLIPAILGSVIFFYGGAIFVRSAASELKSRQPGMMTLISLAIITAYGYSLATTFIIVGVEFFWELSTLISVMLLGHWLEMRSIGAAEGALKELAKLLPDTAEKVVDGETQRIPVSDLRAGDIILVRPGGRFPADGKVIEGVSSANEAAITGESKPVAKEVGDRAIAGTINIDGALQVRVTETGQDTALGRITLLVLEAQSSRSRTQVLADRAAFYLTIVALAVALFAFAGWLLAGASLGFALERAVTVLVIACPHALGLAVPLVVAISTTLGAKNGMLVRERLALEAAREINIVLFDKTGTLTRGEQGVGGVVPVKSEQARDILALAAAVEAMSEHPVGQAIVQKAKGERVEIPAASDFRALPGRGIEGKVAGARVSVGGPRLLEGLKIEVPSLLREPIKQAEDRGESIIYVIRGRDIVGVITLADQIRPESREAIRALGAMGVETAMITGDSQAVAATVARELGIKTFFAEVLPEHKQDKVRELQQAGKRVAMVGDGINDAPALVQADVGVAIGAGTDVAIESAGIILVKNDPRDVARIVTLSRSTWRKMIQNLVWATGYNVVALPLAAGALASFGLILPPAVGALFMSASTIIVALNAQLLRRQKI